MDLADIAVFVEAVQTGSLAAAARRLEIAPMVASRRLAALEAELGTRLIHRTTRALALTPEGEAFLPFAQAMLESEADGRAAIMPSEAGATGLLRITASIPFGRKVVTPIVAIFLEDNPAARVDLLLTDSIVDIVAQGMDIAIRIAPLKDSSLVARKLADNPRALYAAPGYLRRHGVPRQIADLRERQCLVTTGTTHWHFQGATALIRQRVAGRFSASSPEALHRACLDGAGIAILSAWDVREEVAAGQLVELPLIDGTPEPLAIWAIFPTAKLMPLKVRLFVRALEDHLRDS